MGISKIEFCDKLAKCALDNPDLPIEFIRELLIAKHLGKSFVESFKFEDDCD